MLDFLINQTKNIVFLNTTDVRLEKGVHCKRRVSPKSLSKRPSSITIHVAPSLIKDVYYGYLDLTRRLSEKKEKEKEKTANHMKASSLRRLALTHTHTHTHKCHSSEKTV